MHSYEHRTMAVFSRALVLVPDLVPGFGAWARASLWILVVSIQKLEHGTRVRALSPKVVFRHRTRRRALVCTRFHQCHVFYPCFPVIWSYGSGDKMATLQQIETKLRAPRCLNNIPFSARAQWSGTGTKSGHGLSFISPGICNRWISQSIKIEINRNQLTVVNCYWKSISNQWDRILWLFIDFHRKSN